MPACEFSRRSVAVTSVMTTNIKPVNAAAAEPATTKKLDHGTRNDDAL
jgi:hypothetical protein